MIYAILEVLFSHRNELTNHVEAACDLLLVSIYLIGTGLIVSFQILHFARNLQLFYVELHPCSLLDAVLSHVPLVAAMTTI